MCQCVAMPVENPPEPAGSPDDVLACFEAVPAILWAFEGPELVVVAANAGARASAGDRPGIIGRPIRQVLPELEGQQIFEMMEEAYAAARPVAAEHRRVLVDRDGDGRLEEGFFTYTFLPTFHPDHSVRGLVVHIVETTAQARRQSEAEQAAAVSEQRFQQASAIVLDLQRSLLPSGVPVLPGLTCAAQYRVAGDELAAGGDWFDAVALPDGRVALLVGDVVGHGAAAAGAMGQLRAVVLDALTTGEADPDLALRRLDRFAVGSATTRAATVCLAVVDPSTGELAVAAHAHPPPLLLDPSGRVRVLELPESAPLGTGGPPARWRTVRLDVGDTLLLYSDGLVERPGRPLTDTVSSLADTAAAAHRDTSGLALETDTSLPVSAAERLVTVLVERMAFLGDGYQDDVTVLLAQRRDPVGPFELHLDAVPAALPGIRRALTSWLDDLGAAEDDLDALVYSTSEAVANAVEHAYPHRADTRPAPTVVVRGHLDLSGTARITVSDHGRWRSPPAGRSTRGRGALMMRELTDHTEIDHGPDGTTVRLSLALRQPVTIGASTSGPRHRPRPETLTIDVDENSGSATVSGPVDLTTVDRLRAALLHAGRGGTRALCIDLGGVTLLSSAGVQLLHDLAATAPGLTFATDPRRPAHAVLRLAGLGSRLISPDPADHRRDVSTPDA